MKTFTSAARLTVLGLIATGALTGCKKADAPTFSPAPGTYTGTQLVAMSSPTFAATIVYTTDGSAPSCQKEHGTIYSAPVAISANTTLRAMACAPLRDESLITKGSYVIKAPETVATPAFSPSSGTLYVNSVSVSITTATADATIHFTSDGTTPTCASGAVYGGPVDLTQITTLNAIACATGKLDSAVASATYTVLQQPAAPVFDPAPGAYTAVQHVTLTSTTPGAFFRYSTDGQSPVCGGNTPYNGPIEIGNSLTLKAVACATGYTDSPITSGGYDIDITEPPAESVWHGIDFNNLAVNPAVLAAGTTSTNEEGNALNISSRGKVESTQQVFHFVYAPVSGDFTITARLDGVDFAGQVSNQGRVGLLLTPDLTPTGTSLIYGSAVYAANSAFLRSDRIAVGSNSNSTINATGTGARYLKLVRTGSNYRASASLDGGVTWTDGALRPFTAGLPETTYVGFMISSGSSTVSASATFSDVHVRDAAGNEIIGPNQFSGEIGAGTGGDPGGGGGTPPTGPSHADDQSRGATPAEPALVSGSVARFNVEGYAAATVTGGGNIPDTDARYRKVTTATELVAALRAAKASSANPVKVIEILNDLNMGWNEVGTDLQVDGLLRQNIAPKKHPALIASGVSLLDITAFNGLTIYSRNGATIRHAEFNIKAGTNLVLRNLKFDELWEWDEATKGDYDSNDWDFVTIGDGGGVTSGIWVDHCTFTKSYDGVLDIKRGASGITVSWSEVVPAAAGPGSFVQRQFDDLEANRTSNVMYNLLRGAFTEAQIVDIALPQKKGHLIGSNNLEGLTTYTVTLHHNLYKDLQDRMPRLRGGDVHAWNLYVDSSNARIVKEMRDGIVAANPTLATALNSTYHFGITSNASISTEGGAVQIESSVFFGVLTPLRNNQTDVTNPAYTGAINGINIQHILLATDTAYMPAASQQTFFQDRGFTWATWTGDSATPGSTLGPVQAPQIPFVWHNGTPTYPKTVDPIAALSALLTGDQGAGAGKIGMATQQWLQVAN
ncbi:MAG TPA: chitobiase/beta-hexosaminidase C-terminal domain-containing protein [Steroidobacteraceae bacterium]|jgi:pectate lyase|nr:chitobiase/beta-hexosaminidase C-terminal domain-containing protein [Steroidobacteraceae bacterium]